MSAGPVPGDVPELWAALGLVLRATALIGAAWAGAALLRRRRASAATRHLAWLLGIAGLYRVGAVVHVLLLVGLMLLLLGFLKARDAAMRGPRNGPSEKS